MSSSLKEQLKKVKEQNSRRNPDRSWVARNRTKLMSQIGNTTAEEKPRFRMEYIWQMINIFVPGRLTYTVIRPTAVFLLVGAVATSGWIASVGATQNCLPGEICYGVKIAAEKTQELVTVVASSKEQQAQMHMEFASRRAKEVKKVAQNNTDDVIQQAAVAMEKLEKSVQTASEVIQEVAEANPEKMIEVAKDMQEKAKEINQNLTDASEQIGNDVNVDVTKQAVKDASMVAVETAVHKKEEGKTTASDEEVKEIVMNQIDIVVTDAGNIKNKAEDVVKAMMIVSSTTNVAPINLTMAVSSTILTTTSSFQVGEVNRQVVVQDETNQKTLGEAKTLVDNNHLLEAIEKIKDVVQAVQQSERNVIEVEKENVAGTLVAPAKDKIDSKSVDATSTLPKTN